MDFTEALKKHKEKGHVVLIPDIKCYSPKDGELMKGRDPVSVAKQLEKAGACAISVVTEKREFHGSMELLKNVCSAVSVPVLRKDFVTSEKDLDETLAAGASAILLMISCLGFEKLASLYRAALSRGLTPFVETHTYEEYRFALSLGAPLIGINNRDITVLEKDDGTVAHSGAILDMISRDMNGRGNVPAGKHHIHRNTVKLKPGADRPDSPFIIVESALRNGDDVHCALRKGADGVLVGTAILNAADPVRQYLSMTRRCGVKICGLMSGADADACLASDVDICGFVVNYPVDVRWNLDADAAKNLICLVKEKVKACIVTGGEPGKVVSLARELQPDLVQLHYRETFEQTVQIAKELGKDDTGVIRSIPGDTDALEEMFGTKELAKVLEMLADSEIAGILLDSRNAGNAATGGGNILQYYDQNIAVQLDRFAGSGKMILAGGGITSENAGQVMKLLKPDYLDVMTGAENSDGQKSEELIRKLTQTIR